MNHSRSIRPELKQSHHSGGAISSTAIKHVTIWGLVINLMLSAIKFVVGLVSNSQALIADAVHSLSDSATDIAMLVGVAYWTAPADKQHPHGHARIETMVAALIGFALAGVGITIGYNALSQISAAHFYQPGWTAFAAACLSILVKESLYRWTVQVGRRIKSAALLANAWHHRSDALSSLPVAISVLATRLWPTWSFLDHIAAVIVCTLILHAAWRITWPALRELSDAGAAEHKLEKILGLARGTSGVLAVHALRTRFLGAGLQVDLHVQVNPDLSVREGHKIAHAVKQRLLEEDQEIIDVLVHLEAFEENAAE